MIWLKRSSCHTALHTVCASVPSALHLVTLPDRRVFIDLLEAGDELLQADVAEWSINTDQWSALSNGLGGGPDVLWAA